MWMKATVVEWTERLRAWRESGQSAEEFSEGKGYTPKLLRWWAGEFVRREKKKARVGGARVVPRATRALLMIAVGVARIEVAPGFDRALLREVVETLGGGR